MLEFYEAEMLQKIHLENQTNYSIVVTVYMGGLQSSADLWIHKKPSQIC